MQTGYIYRKGQSWILDYGVKEFRNGEAKWVRRSKRLAPVCDKYRTVGSVRHLAADILAPYNAHRANPESTDTVAHYLEHVYLPHCKATLRPSQGQREDLDLRDRTELPAGPRAAARR